jgi:acyl-CoA reductase-like NAD-dependent aldehyde dehydrogenase/nicotinamidase-related amidase
VSRATALLLVDCQEDYLARDGLQPPRETLVASIAEALDAARRQGRPIFHVRTRVSPDGADAMPHRREQPEAVEGTSGAEAPEPLRERDGETVLHKRFFSAFDAEGLEAQLRASGVERLLLAGVHSHACIQATTLDAYARGFEVVIGEELVGSYDPAHAAQALAWLDRRAARVMPGAAILGQAPKPWLHHSPCNAHEMLFEVELQPAEAVEAEAKRLAGVQPLPLAERTARLHDWHGHLTAARDQWVETLVRDLGKPRGDAEGEVGYGLGLLAHVASTLQDGEAGGNRRVRYRPHGIAGLITPWNNPFALPVAKLAPALGYGNSALWKPALPGSGIAKMLHASLAECGLGNHVALVTGDAPAGQAVLRAADVLSFTGSVAVGQMIVAEAGRRFIPVQAELGGSNAAIVDATADLDAAAEDLAAAIFSFAGQRCTAIRRVLVLDAVYRPFIERLVAAVEALRVGDPADVATHVGPVIDRGRQQAFAAMARDCGGTLITGGTIPAQFQFGSWLEPTLVADAPAGHPLLTKEVFGPLAAVVRVPTLDAAIAAHNATGMGLAGALFSQDEAAVAQFLAGAEAGMLSINRARPPFAAEGPFIGWKASGYGTPEHGRWNRDFYTRAQAIYGD